MNLLVDTDTRRKFKSPEARTHKQDYSKHFDIGCICGITNSELFILIIVCCVSLCVINYPGTIMGSITLSCNSYIYSYISFLALI